MTKEELHKQARRLHSQIALFGKWRRRKAAEALEQDGSPEALRVLAKSGICSNHEEIVGMALRAIQRLTDLESINEICAVWADTRHPELAEIIIERGWIASHPPKVKVLSALKTGAIDTVSEDGTAIIKPLLDACEDRDKEIRHNANACLRRIRNQKVVEALCQYVIEHYDPKIQAIVKALQCVPCDPTQRALFYCLTEQWDKYEQLDFDQRLLKKVYPHLDTLVRNRLAGCARKAGRLEWIEVVIGTRKQKQLAEMDDDDWDVAISILSARQAWQTIWLLAQVAPTLWSVRLLGKLSDVRWRPEHEAEQAAFAQISKLAKDCQSENMERV